MPPIGLLLVHPNLDSLDQLGVSKLDIPSILKKGTPSIHSNDKCFFHPLAWSTLPFGRYSSQSLAGGEGEKCCLLI